MFPSLPQDVQLELTALAARYGQPLARTVDLALEGYWYPRFGTLRPPFEQALAQPARTAEVCLVVRRPNGRFITGSKPFYPSSPRRIFRLLTGGVESGETILDPLLRETLEETGLQTEIRRFLTAIAYRTPALLAAGHSDPFFYTFVFLLDEVGGTLGALDERERLDEYREIDPDGLLELASDLDHLAQASPDTLGPFTAGDPSLDIRAWRDWARFRRVAHLLVHESLS